MITKTHFFFLFALVGNALIFNASAFAFQILTPQTISCHENITLASLGVLEAVWTSSEDENLEDLLADFVQKVEASGIKFDDGVRGFFEDVAEKHGFSHLSETQKYVLGSFVLGVRFPDTDGFAVVKFNETRSVHIADDRQARHMLRKSGHDGEAGNIAAIADAKQHMLAVLKTGYDTIHKSSKIHIETKWTFPFYGRTSIKAFGPAFYLGSLAHTIQDSYSHTYRDADMKIVTVGNYVDIVTGQYQESRDGPRHSERLDQCNLAENDFDQLRVSAARKSTARAFFIAGEIFQNPVFDATGFADFIDSILEFRSGCNLENQYCGSAWMSEARKEETEPISITFCGSLKISSKGSKGTPLLLILLPFVFLLPFSRLNYFKNNG